jgi:hypothetical protein
MPVATGTGEKSNHIDRKEHKKELQKSARQPDSRGVPVRPTLFWLL